MMKKLNNKKGFTLAELLVVVAIIAVLVAISIPVFTSQLEKARQATDAANLRAAYAEAATERVSNEDSDNDGTIGQVTSEAMTQTNGTFDKMAGTTIGGVDLSTLTGCTSGKTVTVTVAEDGTPSFKAN